MARRRVQRFNELLRQELSTLLARRVRDPRLSSVTITEVDLTADLRTARIYVSVLDDDEETRQEILHGLHGAAGFLRRELAHRIKIRHTPELIFHLDESARYGEHIDQLLDQIRQADLAKDPHSHPEN
ncbi:MAG: 30S ribosome-binding factor RbfA [Anaerolineae bacterium]|nr:MAG: 30S ribosome-binding factor RbfA [Anaerolineae bacterium]